MVWLDLDVEPAPDTGTPSVEAHSSTVPRLDVLFGQVSTFLKKILVCSTTFVSVCAMRGHSTMSVFSDFGLCYVVFQVVSIGILRFTVIGYWQAC